jgi:methyltransferase (TIGR00027 family)
VKQDEASRTAMATAFLRALHLVADVPPYVFEDRFAQGFLPDYQRRFLARLDALPKRWLGTFRQRRSALGSMRAQILVRARYTEDALAEARSAGATRYLILAAGLDTFTLRQPAGGLPVLEVDHPATQRWKRDKLAEAHTAVRGHVAYLPVDFEVQSLTDVVDAAPGPQFVSWLGTTYYLTRSAIAATLSGLAELSPAGSRLVLDYWRESPLPGDAALLWGTRLATATQQEPMRSFLEPGEAEDMARAAGWRVREHCAPEIQNQRYLRRRRDDLAVPAFACLLQLER